MLSGERGGAALTRRAIEVLEGSGPGLELAITLRQCAEMSDSEDLWRRGVRARGSQVDAVRAQGGRCSRWRASRTRRLPSRSR
ncbi:MAG: hypothetical protein ABIQ18_35765 [Umezawaea sp.]